MLCGRETRQYVRLSVCLSVRLSAGACVCVALSNGFAGSTRSRTRSHVRRNIKTATRSLVVAEQTRDAPCPFKVLHI